MSLPRSSLGQAPADRLAVKPYRGNPAVGTFRGGNGNVGIIRSPVRAIALPDSRLRQAEPFIRHRCRQEQVGLEELRMGSRRRRIAAVRTRLAVDLVTRFGLSLAETARQLGVSTSGIAKAIARAERP